MATYKITATYEYEGEIEADSPDEAEKIFLDGLNDYYVGTDSYECEEVEEEDDEEENLEILLHDAELEDEEL